MSVTAAQIMGVPDDRPELLFGANASNVATIARDLFKIWHPDHNKDEDAADVIAKVVKLRDTAERLIKQGVWPLPGHRRLVRKDGGKFDLKVVRSHPFELGEILVGGQTISYAIDAPFLDMVHPTPTFSYRNPKEREVFERTVPIGVKETSLADGRTLITSIKGSDQFLLKDLIAYEDGSIPMPHATWITTRLMAIAAFLETNALVHPAIGPDTVMVSPQFHSATLVGGWLYAAKTGEKFIGAPQRTMQTVPPVILNGGIASSQVMGLLIRQTMREMIGKAKQPRPLQDWLTSIPRKTALEDYEFWERVREASFGERKFVEYRAGRGTVYPEIKPLF